MVGTTYRPSFQASVEAAMRRCARAIESDVCVHCGNDVGKFRDDESEHEYRLSGLCQPCQDDIFN